MHPTNMDGCWQRQVVEVTEEEYASLHAWMRRQLISAASTVVLPGTGGYSVLAHINDQRVLFDGLADELLAEAGVEVTNR